MGLFNRKPKVLTPEQAEEIYTKDFFDMILPSTIKFFTDYYIVGTHTAVCGQSENIRRVRQNRQYYHSLQTETE